MNQTENHPTGRIAPCRQATSRTRLSQSFSADSIEYEWSRTTGLPPREDVPIYNYCPFGAPEPIRQALSAAARDVRRVNQPFVQVPDQCEPPTGGQATNDKATRPPRNADCRNADCVTEGASPGIYCFEITPQAGTAVVDQTPALSEPRPPQTAPVFVWAPRGIPAGRRTLLLSSRVGRRPQDDLGWLLSLRHVAQRIGRSKNSVLVTAPKLTCDAAARRIAARNRLPFLTLLTAGEAAARPWLTRWAASENGIETEVELDDGEFPLIFWSIRPELIDASYDGWAALVADEIHVLKVRSNGNVERAVQAALNRGRRVYLVHAANFEAPKNTVRLQRDGAVPLLVLPQHRPKRRTAAGSVAPGTDAGRRSPAPAIISLKEWNPHRKPFLFHWTRPRQGPWPDQDQAAYWDELLESPKLIDWQVEWGPCDSLTRILCQRQILPTNRLIRGKHRVVCFTQIPLQSFKQRRVFRNHLSRWDFSPFGIGIRRRELERLGARAVIYGDSTRWESLSESDRPFFQFHDRAGNDWRAEREWRIVGKVDLGQLSPESAVVFVPDRPTADFYARLSRWPVVYLNDTLDQTRQLS